MGGGLVEAFDAVATPPTGFASWSSHRLWCAKCEANLSRTQRRRNCNYLEVMARAPPSVNHLLGMSSALFERLTSCHDIQSLVRRPIGGGVHFETNIANEMIVTARMAV